MAGKFRAGAYPLLFCLWFTATVTHALGQYGSFPHPLDLRMSANGRDATLLSVFSYVDGGGKVWEVPAGTSVDGASIPWPLWSIIGSPWTGRYREASVVHDYFCETKKAPWKLVHRNFYTAMLANGVDQIQAKVMYAAVYRFGPRWDFEYTPECPNCAAVPHRVDEFTPSSIRRSSRRCRRERRAMHLLKYWKLRLRLSFSATLRTKKSEHLFSFVRRATPMLNGWRDAGLCAAVLLSGLMPTHADTVHLHDGGSIAGRVVAFDRENVAFSEGCGGGGNDIPWTKIARLEFGGCDSKPDASLQAIESRCVDERFWVFMVEFKGYGTPVISESAAITKDGLLHIDMFDPWDQAHGTIDYVRQVTKVTVCRGEIKREVTLPNSYCSEPRQVAVAFDYRTPFSNRVLTNGFSFYLRVSGKRPENFDLDAFRKEIRSAFQHGISLWTSALQDHKHLLTAPIQRFLETRTSRSKSGYTLLTPPQVIELSCPQSATFVVDLSFGNRSLFPRPPLVLAKAQTEGRTVALNVFDIKCYQTELWFDEKKRLRFELAGGCLNLVPIMTHELGHAFGIKHIDDSENHALMDSRFSRDALTPTERDVIEFVAVLGRGLISAKP